jgi:hypothetical protein
VEIKARSAEHSTGATLKEGNEDIREQEQAKNVKLFLREPQVSREWRKQLYGRSPIKQKIGRNK